MCEDYPKHDDVDIIAGKIWLIGHSYSASINRVRNSDVLVDNFIINKVAPKIKDSDIDKWIDSLKDIDRVTFDNYQLILDVHKKFTDLLYEITELQKRSLASKYLHFHLPKSIFIYDSIANSEIQELTKDKKIQIPNGFDREYSKFVLRCLEFREKFESEIIKKTSTPRDLDSFLLKYDGFSSR